MKPWGCAAYAYDSSHKNERLILRGKKYIFIRNFKYLKGHVFIGEKEMRNINEFKSQDVTFLNIFLDKRKEVKTYIFMKLMNMMLLLYKSKWVYF